MPARRTLAALAILAALGTLPGCATAPVGTPYRATDHVRLGEPPSGLQGCRRPAPPPVVPPAPRTVERLAAYAWDEARARWETAEALKDCSAKLRKLNAWIREHNEDE